MSIERRYLVLLLDKKTGAITMIAKDTGDVVVSLRNYLLDTGDTVYFTVHNGVERENPKIQKVITEFKDHMAFIRLDSEDTNLPVGLYFYDIQINTADGRIDTVIGPAKFRIKGGITY